jgi:hypothetical protein
MLGKDLPQVTRKGLCDQAIEREPTVHLRPVAEERSSAGSGKIEAT